MTLVDVIIPTYNRPARLARTLAALQRQTFQDFLVFVADDASSPPVRCPEPAGAGDVTVCRSDINLGPAGARNRAVALGRSQLLAFVDDDVDPAVDWLAGHVAAHQRRGEMLVTIGPLLAPANWDPTPWNWWEAATLAREYRRMQEGLYEPTCRQFFTGNAMVRRVDFERAGGFDEGLSRAEDVELGLRLQELGCAFEFLPFAIGWHYSRRTFASWTAMATKYAEADLRIAELHPGAGWAAMLDEEMVDRGRAMRLARLIAGLPGMNRPMRQSLRRAAELAFRSGGRDTSTRLLSVLYDVTYTHAARRLAATATGQFPAGDPASTGPQPAAPSVSPWSS